MSCTDIIPMLPMVFEWILFKTNNQNMLFSKIDRTSVSSVNSIYILIIVKPLVLIEAKILVLLYWYEGKCMVGTGESENEKSICKEKSHLLISRVKNAILFRN